ncbi:MAG: hypothetical protein FJ197_03310 [Gammaproteobacteria bacterium]|nr:hypothetical protein [Gammaproteobacteria bacterium]
MAHGAAFGASTEAGPFGPEFRIRPIARRRQLAAHLYPREIEFVTDLPKTPGGKVQRFLLRGRG